ncbi:MAG: Zn-dependent hydrolase [Chlamydiae bacterium RIFCSPLOWO2_01_FULL_28_7]|nr:MAG: Zn-dependent hydrolase [Chlamydiae bacterium RIFCSPLOWO2_01_FULL_28_7]
MLKFCPLSSGSKGNSIFLKTEKTKILIDVGISFQKLEKKLLEINEDIFSIEAVFITHEHFDHAGYLKTISEKLNIPVIINSETLKGIYKNTKFLPKAKIFTTGEEFEFNDLIVHSFSLPHDTLEPVGFTFIKNKTKIAVCTDLGFVTSLIKKRLKDTNILFIEANHDVNMVHASNRPKLYKDRVLSKHGHISNEECFDLIKDIMHDKLTHIYLSHISEECNSIDLLKNKSQIFLKNINRDIEINIAYQNKISKCIEI